MNPLLDKIEEGDAYIILEDRNDLFNTSRTKNIFTFTK